MTRSAMVAVALVFLVSVSCDTDAGGSGTATDANLSVAFKLAVIDGDSSKEAAFQDAIDCIMATGIEGAETEEKVGDTLVASWEAGGKSGSLLEWAQVLCSG